MGLWGKTTSRFLCLAALLAAACGSGEEPVGPTVFVSAPASAYEGIQLPVAETGAEDWPAAPFLEIVATPDLEVWFDGEKAGWIPENHPLNTRDLPREKHHLKGVSLQPVLLNAHGDLPWGIIDGCIQKCFEAGLPRIHLAVRRSPDRLDSAFLPTCFPWLEDEDALTAPADYAARWPSVSLSWEEDELVVIVTDPLGMSVSGGPRPLSLDSPELPTLLGGLAAPGQDSGSPPEPWRLVNLGAEAFVPYRHVVALADACRRAGFDRIAFRYEDLYRYGPRVLEILGPMTSRMRKEMQLPVCSLPNVEPPDEYNVEVGITREGKLFAWGREYDLQGLTRELYKVAECKRFMDKPAQPSANPVVIVADARVAWQEVRSVIGACAGSTVRMPRIYWSTMTPEGEERRVAVHLPGPDLPPAPEVWIWAWREEEDGELLMRIDPAIFGKGRDGLEKLSRQLKLRRGISSNLVAAFECDENLPFGDVVKVLEAARSAGVKDVHFAWR